MIQYFKTKLSKNGNNLQLIINHEKKSFKYGYFLGLHDSVTVSKKDMQLLHDQIVIHGFKNESI